MPAAKKKPQLDELVRHSIALLWAYNGDDLILLTYLPDEQRFDEYCQAKKRSFRVLNLGTWFSISYQRYIKCEARINVLDVTVLEETQIRTRVVDAFVQFCVRFVRIKANPYSGEYAYSSSLGNIVLKKHAGGGPKHMLIWCSLQKVAWWNDPIFEEIEESLEELEERTQREFIMVQSDSIDEGCNGSRATTSFCPLSTKTDYDDNRNIQGTSNSLPIACFEDDYDDVCIDQDFAGNADEPKIDQHYNEIEGEKHRKFLEERKKSGEFVQKSPKQRAKAKETPETDTFSLALKEHIDTIRIEELLSESSDSHLNLVRLFNWQNLAVGIVVERIKTLSDDATTSNQLFLIFPLCTNERFPNGLKLRTERSLKIGQWICFTKTVSAFGEIGADQFGYQPQMFRTISYIGKVVIECEIVFPERKKGGEIKTVCEQWQTELERHNQICPTPFIRHIGDDFGLFGSDLLGAKRWASLVYARMDWCAEKTYWNIAYIRPDDFNTPDA